MDTEVTENVKRVLFTLKNENLQCSAYSGLLRFTTENNDHQFNRMPAKCTNINNKLLVW